MNSDTHQKDAGKSGPLAGVKVVDMTGVVMGPYATQLLAQLGADVIKVESEDGDNTRQAGPARHPGMGHRFLHLNKGKRSLVLDLRSAVGREALLKLAEGADVLVYNLRPQAMARLGLRYEDLCARNPKLIYVGGYGFSEAGPYAGRPAYDDLIQGMTGMAWLSAKASGGEPGYVPTTLFDRVVGLHIVYAVTAALYRRTVTGTGQAVEVPMFEAIAEMILEDHMGGRTFEPPLGTSGYDRVLARGRRPYQTRDGYLCVLIYNDGQWKRFFSIVGKESEFASSGFATLEGRARAAESLNAFVASEMSKRSTSEWEKLCAEADIPASALRSIDEVIDDPHLNEVGMLKVCAHPTEGAIRDLNSPVRWAGEGEVALRPSPVLGQHSREVLQELGYDEDYIDRMFESGATGGPAGSTTQSPRKGH